MVFSSLVFTFFFLPPIALIYYLAKDKYRNVILVVASLLFYSYGEPSYVFLMTASVIANFLFGIWIGKEKFQNREKTAHLIVFLSVIANVGTLFVFKYLNYSIAVLNSVTGSNLERPDIRLPIGISFFTFQAMSYCIDVYRGKVQAQKNIMYVALYISFFPQLIAGPIVRYSSIEDQILNRKAEPDDVAEGIRRFFLGFCKKVILANNLAPVATEVFSLDPSQTEPTILWIGSITFTLQIFYDFSGYSDMTIGLARMFGFKFDENFDYPYISASISEFWRRWHISLGSWFRDYVYIPLGGSRVRFLRNVLNLFIVWTLTGLWHGANITFVIWGLFYFVLLVMEKWLIRPEKRNIVFSIIWRIITLLAINFGWVIFNSEYISGAVAYIKGMIGLYGWGITVNHDILRITGEYGFYFAAGILFATPIMPWLEKRLSDHSNKTVRAVYMTAAPLLYCFAFLWAVSFLILGFHNPFIYFNF